MQINLFTTMYEQFKKFIENISLSKKQREDAMTKYVGACKTLNSEFYNSKYSDSVKFLFGSYKKKTTILHTDKDVDVIFKIPKTKFNEYQEQDNGPSNLLTKVKNTLKDTYPTTDKIKNWTKVVLIDFLTFKVEVLPAFEQDNGKYTIPNTGEGEDWIRDFDPKSEIDNFYTSNTKNNNITRNLIKIIKKWKIEKESVDIKTYILDKNVINFLNNYSFENYPKTIADFFEFLHKKKQETYIETVKNKTKKAYDLYKKDDIVGATKEYKDIFSNSFPKILTKDFSENVDYIKAPNEQFIEDFFPISIDDQINIEIETRCKPQKGGFMKSILLSKLPTGWVSKRDDLDFTVSIEGLSGQYTTKWKVRNFGEEATRDDKLRGEILEDNYGAHRHKDRAAFYGEHFLECYIVQDGVCVARKKVVVPI